jgi:hypothetical protein
MSSPVDLRAAVAAAVTAADLPRAWAHRGQLALQPDAPAALPDDPALAAAPPPADPAAALAALQAALLAADAAQPFRDLQAEASLAEALDAHDRFALWAAAAGALGLDPAPWAAAAGQLGAALAEPAPELDPDVLWAFTELAADRAPGAPLGAASAWARLPSLPEPSAPLDGPLPPEALVGDRELIDVLTGDADRLTRARVALALPLQPGLEARLTALRAELMVD